MCKARLEHRRMGTNWSTKKRMVLVVKITYSQGGPNPKRRKFLLGYQLNRVGIGLYRLHPNHGQRAASHTTAFHRWRPPGWEKF